MRLSSPRFLLLGVSLALAACPCGKKQETSSLLKDLPAAKVSRAESLVPAMPLVLVSSDARGTWEALLASELGKALVKGKAIEDLEVSAQIEDLLTVGHDLASASAKPLLAAKLAEGLSGRAALALDLAEERGQRSDFVAAKEIDASQESTVRLALMAAALKEGEGLTFDQHEGQRIAEIVRGGRTLFVSVFSNVVLGSNRKDLLQAAVARALGKGDKGADTDEGLKEEASSLKGTQALVRWELDPNGWGQLLTGMDTAIVRLELGAGESKLKVRGALPDDVEVGSHKALAYVPKTAVLFASFGATSPEALLNRIASMEGVPTAEVETGFALSERVVDGLGKESFYALLGVEGDRPTHLVGVSVKDRPAVEKGLEKMLTAWNDGNAPTPLSSATGWCTYQSLCVALTEDYLLAAQDQESLQAAVDAGLGNQPALSDVKGIAKVGEKRFLAAYLNTKAASDSALTFLREVARGSSQGFDTEHVEESATPLLEALATLPAFGGALDAKGETVVGELRALTP